MYGLEVPGGRELGGCTICICGKKLKQHDVELQELIRLLPTVQMSGARAQCLEKQEALNLVMCFTLKDAIPQTANMEKEQQCSFKKSIECSLE